ncbi:MAG TPA: hypothetical protein DCS97_12030, partial [Planctomycetes bacterium]|nr:hypothetical protein [Planctomycetota bacterium]
MDAGRPGGGLDPTQLAQRDQAGRAAHALRQQILAAMHRVGGQLDHDRQILALTRLVRETDRQAAHGDAHGVGHRGGRDAGQ